MVELKVRKFGRSLGVILPMDVINRLHIKAGESLFLIDAADSSYLLTHDPASKKAGDIINRYRNALQDIEN